MSLLSRLYPVREDIESYDFKVGYPSIPIFEL